jgi:hypothetical protein
LKGKPWVQLMHICVPFLPSLHTSSSLSYRFNWEYLFEQFSIKKIHNLQPGDENFIPKKVGA